jgi:phosphoribosylaminoimidazole-succinocarboxamide synthase
MKPTLIHQGKVRDVYGWGDDLLLVASDRISAFDVILPTPIHGKGIALTQIARFWFDHFGSKIRHHVIGFDLPEGCDEPSWRHRTTWCKRASTVPMECVVRGYLSGSGWKDYQKTGAVQGHRLPPGLAESDRLPEPIFTPTTKAAAGHDAPLTEEEGRHHVGAGLYDRLKKLSLELYQAGHDLALQRGIIIADTKFEFGWIDGELTVIDEILTPDSSRFWPKESYAPGRGQESYDKQFVRDYLLGLKDWNMQPPGPVLPEAVVKGTQDRYATAYKLLSGRDLSEFLT